MTYTEMTVAAERIALLEGEDRGEVIAWLTSSNVGEVEDDSQF